MNIDEILATPQARIVAALAEARKARHHPECHCRMFAREFCNAADALWQRAVNRELQQITGHTDSIESAP